MSNAQMLIDAMQNVAIIVLIITQIKMDGRR